MFDLKGLRECLIDEIADKLEWDESDEDDDELLLDFQNFHDNINLMSEKENCSKIFEVNKDPNVSGNDFYLGRDNSTRWNKILPEMTNNESSNSMFQEAGPSNEALNAKTIENCFNLFIDNRSLEIIVCNTNLYIASIRHQYSRERDCQETNIDEVKTLIGLILLTSLLKSKNVKLDELWEQGGLGVEVFRLSMNLNRFKFLLRCLRFNTESNKSPSEKTDRLAPIKNLFDLFTDNCRNNFMVSSDAILYQQIVEYKGIGPSLITINKESPRFGLKIYTLVDSCFNYILNMKIFINKRTREGNVHSNSTEKYIKRIIEGFKCNLLLMDNLATFPVMENLIRDNISAIGELNGREPEIPVEFLSASNEEETRSFYGYQNNLVLTSYFDHNNENRVLLSTLHNIEADNMLSNKLPEDCYINGVHATERLKKIFLENSVSRRTRRFSLRIWFHLLDVAILNSFIVYSINSKLEISRRDFLKQLGLSLVVKAIQERAKSKYLPRQLREDAAQFSSSDSFRFKLVDASDNKPIRCSVCPRSKDIKIRTFCYYCKLPMCKKHMISACEKCLNPVNDEQ